MMTVERNLVQRMDTLRSEISNLIRGMHEENVDTIKSLSNDIHVLNRSMTTLFVDKHRIEGGGGNNGSTSAPEGTGGGGAGGVRGGNTAPAGGGANTGGGGGALLRLVQQRTGQGVRVAPAS